MYVKYTEVTFLTNNNTDMKKQTNYIALFLLSGLAACTTSQPAATTRTVTPTTSGAKTAASTTVTVPVPATPVSDYKSAATLPPMNVDSTTENAKLKNYIAMAQQNLGSNATISQQGETIMINFSRADIFGLGNYQPSASSQSIFLKLVKTLQDIPNSKVIIAGDRPKANPTATEKSDAHSRAATVAGFLSKGGVDKNRLFIDDFSSKFPASAMGNARVASTVDFLVVLE